MEVCYACRRDIVACSARVIVACYGSNVMAILIMRAYSVWHGCGGNSNTPDMFMPLLAHVLYKRLRIHRPRTVVVRFVSERLRDDIYRRRTALKTHNADHRDRQIFIRRRGKLAYDTRQLKKAHKISDCWTTYGKVMTKDLAGRITEVKSPGDLLHY